MLSMNKFISGLLCGTALYICEYGGAVLENRKAAKVIANAACVACSFMLAAESSIALKKSLEEALPVVGKNLKDGARNIRENLK